MKAPVFSGLAMAEGLTRENTEEEYYLAVQTRFVRQRNRLTGQDVYKRQEYGLREGGCLADIAPTLIELMGMEQPKEMTGKSLLVKR